MVLEYFDFCSWVSYNVDSTVAFNQTHANWIALDGTTRARAGVPLNSNSTASATRVSPTGNGREFDIIDSNGTITAREWFVPAGRALDAAQQATAMGFADMDNVVNSQVRLNPLFYNRQSTSGDSVAGYDATRAQ